MDNKQVQSCKHIYDFAETQDIPGILQHVAEEATKCTVRLAAYFCNTMTPATSTHQQSLLNVGQQCTR